MTITHNGEEMTLEDGATVADLLTVRFDDPRPNGIAVAVNGEVVPRDEWIGSVLRANDVVDVVAAVQGG